MDIVHELIVRVPPEQVFAALTEPAQIASWFAPDVDAEPAIGSVAEFRFDRGAIRVEILELEPAHKVVWKIVQGLPGWEGITGIVTWALKPNPFGGQGTMLNYTHTGWPAMTGPYPSVNFRSAWYIARLQSYVEKGVATPIR